LPAVGWTALCALAVALPLLFGAARPEPPVAPAVAALWVPGKLNIIELSDFECPFCRILHPRLKEVIEAYGERVHLVRVSVPLKSHPNAENATKSYLCARHQGKGEVMAHELFVSERLDPAAIKEMSNRVGLDTQAFDHCLIGEQAQRSLDEELRRARAITYKGLPTLWVGKRTLLGAHDVDKLRDVIDEELSGEPAAVPSLPQGSLWGLLGSVFVGAAAFAIVRRQPDEALPR
jgi:predicted DsbA family dithiol-disulfide isomerase